MIVTADWVIPVASPPIRHGALLLRGTKIREVGTIGDLVAACPRDAVHELPGCVVIPGLVNAHTHLSLTALGGLLDERELVPWLQRIVAATRVMSPDDHADSAALGAVRCLESGTTCVGDIAYGPESLSAAADAGVGGVFFWEVLGMSPSGLAEAMAEREFPTSAAACGKRSRCGISSHSPYTCGPGLIRATRQVARAAKAPFAIHVAESRDELRLLLTGDGGLESTAARLAYGFRPPRKRPVAYLDSLEVLDGAVAIHCVQVDGRDARVLAEKASGAVLCPRSNARLGNGAPPVALLDEAGVVLALGTDSAASNDDLDLFAEARALRAVAPGLTADRTLRIMTTEGARVLGVGALYGTLEPGRSAELVAVRTGPTDTPIETVLEAGGASTITAVMSSGLWRVIDGVLVGELSAIERAAAEVTEKARSALALG